MTAPVYLTSSDIARVLDVTPSTISNWKQRGKMGNLPEPAAYAGGSPLWRIEDVRALLDERYSQATAYLDTLGES